MGQSPDSNCYNDIGAGLPFFQGNADFGDKYPTARKWCNAPAKIAYPGDILISVRAPIGAINYAKEKCCIGRGLAALTPDITKVYPEFIFWLLKGKHKELNSKGTGSTFKAISRKVLEEVQVPSISHSEQKKISNILDKIYTVKQLQQKQLEELDALIKARFVEMFGNITEKVPLMYYISSLKAGKSLSGEAESKYKVLKTSAVSYDYFDGTQVKNLPIDYTPLLEHKVLDGDVLISRMNTVELVGAAAYVWKAPENTYLPDRLWKVSLRDNCDPIYIWQALIQPETKETLKKVCGGTSGSMKNISKSQLLSIKTVRAPRQQQIKFADFVRQVDKSKSGNWDAINIYYNRILKFLFQSTDYDYPFS